MMIADHCILCSSFLVLRNPIYFIFLILLGAGAYVTYTLNLWGPMLRMTNAASGQGLEIFKEKLREFLESSETGRQAIGMSQKATGGSFGMDTLHSNGTTKARAPADEEVDEI